MSLWRQLAAQALGPLVGGALHALGGETLSSAADKVTAFLSNHFTDNSQALTRALQQANEQAWRALEIVLAGPSLLARCRGVLAPADERAFRQQVQAFLAACPLPDGDEAFRARCLQELQAARAARLLDPPGEGDFLSAFADPRHL